MPPKRLLYPGQLPAFRFEKRIRPNIAERRAAMRVSMSKLRRRKLEQFDYEAYRAVFAKRYISTNVIRWYFSLLDLQHTHDDLEENERNWPPNLPDPRSLYADFYNKIHDMLYNIVCASCGCIGHNQLDYTLVSVLDQRLSCLKVEPRSLVLYDSSCGISALDEQNIMIDPLGIQQDDSHPDIWLCSTCHPSVMLGKRPPESLANFR